jgi:hypothetical protein
MIMDRNHQWLGQDSTDGENCLDLVASTKRRKGGPTEFHRHPPRG